MFFFKKKNCIWVKFVSVMPVRAQNNSRNSRKNSGNCQKNAGNFQNQVLKIFEIYTKEAITCFTCDYVLTHEITFFGFKMDTKVLQRWAFKEETIYRANP